MGFFKKLIKISAYIIVIITVLKMSFEIWKIPDYRKGSAQFVYSEDKEYKGMVVSNKTKTKTTAILVRVKDNEVLAYEPFTKDSSIGPKTAWFSCYGFSNINKPCFAPAIFLNDPIMLPPSLWHRVQAWLTVKIRGFENSNLYETNLNDIEAVRELYKKDNKLKLFYKKHPNYKDKNLK